MDVQVVDHAELQRYEGRVAGELVGFAQYRLQGDRITMFHTEVGSKYEGQGVGSQIIKFALDDIRRRGLELDPRCSFIAAYVRRHSDPYLDLVVEAVRDKIAAG